MSEQLMPQPPAEQPAPLEIGQLDGTSVGATYQQPPLEVPEPKTQPEAVLVPPSGPPEGPSDTDKPPVLSNKSTQDFLAKDPKNY